MSNIEPLPRPNERRLPRAVAGRFRPTRAGIRNVWEYDEQEFWFEGGWLVLRGHNTAGKSKALELLFPFVLDGDVRPERLDPFGGRTKTMYWNLIEFDEERRSAIGYCWAEFGRVDEAGQEHFVTVLVGMRAQRSAGRRVETWFAVTSQRVGAGLDLAPGGVPLTSERLREVLEGAGQFTTTAREHRMSVDRALFDLGAERYEALLHLLLQLRRPKLSEKLDVTKLAEVLSDALPPLERGRVENLAQAFGRLDADRAEIETLEAALAELETFSIAYRAYAEIQTRLRSDRVRQANTQLDKVTETERRERAEREQAGIELDGIETRRHQLGLDIERIRGQLEGLDLSKVHALVEVEHRATEAAERAEGDHRREEADRLAATARGEDASAAAAGAAAAEARLGEASNSAASAADAVGLGAAHVAHATQLAAAPESAVVALGGAADRREAELVKVREAAQAESLGRQRLEHAAYEHRSEAEQLAVAADELEECRTAVEEASTAFAAAADGWLAATDPALSRLLTVGVPAELATAERGATLGGVALEVLAEGGEHAVRAMAARLGEPARSAIASDRAVALGEARRVEAEQRWLSEHRGEIAAERDDAPPGAPGRPAEHGPGTPLWRCVEFASGLTAEEEAGLEAAMHASGLLDALVTPTGELLDPATHETRILTGVPAGEPTLLEWLHPTPEGPLTFEAVAEALQGVAATPHGHEQSAGAAPRSAVALDGKWINGALRGRWHKASAEFIGATARAAARARRIVELDERIAALADELAEVERRAQALAALESVLASHIAAFPQGTEVREALSAQARAAREAARRRSAAESAEARLRDVEQELAELADALSRAELQARCRAAELEELVTALGRYRLALRTFELEARATGRERAMAAAAELRRSEAEEAAHRSATEADQSAALLARVRGEATELRGLIGADVEAVLARKAQLDEELDEAVEEQRVLAVRRDEVRTLVDRAEQRLATTEEDREERERERAEALQSLARLGATELATIALGPVDPDRDLTQVTAGLSFARAAYERLHDVEVGRETQDASTNGLHEAFTHLRRPLEGFDPHLDTSDGVSLCVATLNGSAIGVSALRATLDEQVRRRRATLSEEERRVIEQHLLTELGTHLGERAHGAWLQVTRMNEELQKHPTRGGSSLHLNWNPDSEAGTGAVEALRLLRRISSLTSQERVTVAAFLADRVDEARADSEGGEVVDRLAAALDYRLWHRFTIARRTEGREERFTARTQGAGSGGEQAKLAHLPLFAATAAYYATADPHAPHLLMLDEAFAGIDDSQRGDCMGMLAELDLDVVLTNYAEWACYPEVPAVAIYHLERTPGVLGVAALRFVWDGQVRREDDPFLDDTYAGSPS